MPMYEYKCANCGKRFELIQKFSDEPLTVHEECGSGPVERLISAPALKFKGTGWYVTDYAKGNGGGSDKPKSESSQSEGSKSEGSQSESSKSEGSKSESSSGSKSESGGGGSPAPAGKSGSDS